MVPHGTTSVAVVDLENLARRQRGGVVDTAGGDLSDLLDAHLPAGCVRVGAAATRSADRFREVTLDDLQVTDDGPDGADRRLLAILRELPSTVDDVWIVSGDARFAHRALMLSRQGVRVTVLAKPGSLAPRLARAATRVIAC